jgi:hypothetical protein
MKKILTLAVVAIASAFGVNAENWYVGGNFGIWHDSDSSVSLLDNQAVGTSSNAFYIQPEIGYNFNSQWAVGLGIGYEYKHYCGTKTSDNFFNFNPYARWSYFRTSNNLVQLFIDGTVGFGAGVRDVDVDGYDSHTACTWEVGFRPGVAFNLTDRFSIVAHLGFLGYQGANHTAEKMGKHNAGGLDLSTENLTLGFFFNF